MDIPKAAVDAVSEAIGLDEFDARDALEAAVPILAEAAAKPDPDPDGLGIGGLREGLTYFTDLGGMLGSNLHESRKVLVRVHDHMFTLTQVSATFYQGRFVIILDGETRG
jgi:hypothetical protein